MKKQILLAGAAVLTLAAASAAQAQSIDYGSLQSLFGEPVTTSATGSPQRSSEAPVDMTIITADDIKRSGATDLPTILSRVPGIDILNWSATQSDVSVNGYNAVDSSRLLVMINGREVYLSDFGYTSWANLPVQLSEIRQIEVVRGPNSALFGFNAVGGVINIITYNPKYDDVSGFDVHGGTQSSVGGSLLQTLHLGDRIAVRLSAGAERQDQWSNLTAASQPWNARSAVDAVVTLGPKTDLRLEGSFARSADDELTPLGNFAQSLYTTKSARATLASDTSFGAIQAQAYINNLQDDADKLLVKNQEMVASLQDLFKLDARNTFRLALEYRSNRENVAPTTNSAHISYSVWSPSAMWNFAATSKLSLTAAGRVDELSLERTGLFPTLIPQNDSQWNQSFTAFSANLGAVYKLTSQDTLRAAFARGVQVPTLVEYGALSSVRNPGPPPGGLALAGNPSLVPTIVTNYELSEDHALTRLNALIGVKVFYQQNTGILGKWDFATPSVPGTATTVPLAEFDKVSDSDLVGFSLTASGKIAGGFHWSADTTYTNVVDQAYRGADLVARAAAFAETTPKFRGNLAAGWSNARWTVDGYLHYVSRFSYYSLAGALAPEPAYATLAARIGYKISDSLVAAISGQNLGTERQLQGQPGSLLAERRVLFSVTKSW